MAFLLDTNIVIYDMNGVETASQLIETLLDTGPIAISTITLMEILEGLQGRYGPSSAEQRFIAFSRQSEVLDFGREEAQVAAHIRHSIRAVGRNVRHRPLDLMIAATALSYDLTLVTSNAVDYQDVPDLRLKVAELHV